MASKNVVVKKKKKNWYTLYAPESLNNAFLGETTVYAPEAMIGKTVSMNLAMITGDMKKQNVITTFRVTEVKEGKGLTELVGYSLSLAYIKRLVRRKRDKIDDSFLAKTKDSKIVRVKTVAMTNSKTYDSASSAIRLSLRAKIKKALKEATFEEFVNSLVNIRLQKEWKNSLGKIYPLKFLEVRYVSLEDVKKNIKDEEEKDYTETIKSDEDEFVDEEADAKESKKKKKPKSEEKEAEVIEEADEEIAEDDEELELSDDADDNFAEDSEADEDFEEEKK